MGAGASDTIERLALLNMVNGLRQSGVGFGALGELFALQLIIEVPHLVVHGLMEVHMAREDLLPPDVVWALVEKGIKCSFFPPVILPVEFLEAVLACLTLDPFPKVDGGHYLGKGSVSHVATVV